MNTPTRKIIDNETADVTLVIDEAAVGAIKADRIALSLESGSMVITGKLSPDCTAFGVAAVRDADMSLVTGTISTAGLYIVTCDAYDEIIVSGTSATVYAKYLY